jgi:dipeptidyl aminopeptidase/acylaminoacyl peptidase
MLIKNLAHAAMIVLGTTSLAAKTAAGGAVTPGPELLPRLVEIADVTPPVVSPDGGHVAFSVIKASVETNAYIVTWFVAPTDGSSAPWPVHDGGDLRIQDGFPHAGRAAWSPGGGAFAFPVTRGDEAALHVYIMSTGVTEAVGPAFGTIEEFVFVDDWTVLATVGPRPPRFVTEAPYPRTGGIVIHPREPRNLSAGLGGFAVSASEAGTFAREIVTLTLGQAYAPDAHEGAETAFARGAQVGALSAMMIPAVFDPVTPRQGAALAARFAAIEDASGFGASDDGSALAFLAREENWHTVFVDDGSGRPPIPADELDHAPSPLFAWTREGDAFFLATSAPAGWQVRKYASTGEKLGTWEGSGQIVATGGVDRAGRLIVLWSDVGTPGDIMALDPEAGLVRLTEFNPYFSSLATPRPLVLKVQDRYGRDVRARVYVPEACAAQGKCPVVVHIYGTTGFPRGGNGDEWPFLELLRRGFVVIDANPPADRIDYSNEGTAEAQSKYVDGPVSGAVALVDALAGEGIVDPKRAGIVGLSFGAMVASWGALKTDRFAASSSAGIDLYYATQGLVNGNYDPFMLAAIRRGDGNAVMEYLGMNVAPTARAAMLSHEPEEEYRAFLPLIGLLRAFDRPVEQIVYADEGHVKTQPRNRLEIYRRNAQWFDFWLAGREDADPVDKTQYERWRALRDKRNLDG